jgi:DUF4097 and DUF4098 domain-containing protein YvlB
MKKTLLVITLFTMCSCWLFETTSAQQKRNRNISVTTSGDDKIITECGQIKIRIGDTEAIRSEQVQTIPRAAISSLQARPHQNGGIHVQGWDRDEYEIKACLAARSENPAEAKAILDGIKLSIQDGVVKIDGPNREDWVGYLLVQAPRAAILDLSSMNGPIGINGISGNVQARAVNGPITFNDVSGTVKADVQNGPITVSGSAGDFRLSAQNGPLTIDLVGNQWTSGSLEGHTENGPLTLRVPESYQSSVRVDASKHSPIQCQASQCREAVRTWDRPSRIQFGAADPVVRLSTVNGPVTITSPKH